MPKLVHFCVLLCATLFAPWAVWAASPVLLKQGEYLYRAAGCGGCHIAQNGADGVGGLALRTPFGVFQTPNITSDPETGIGRWREQDFVRALRQGVSPAGDHYYPAFPYTSYARMTDADIGALWAYVRSFKPVRRANDAHALPWYLRSRAALAGWKWLHFNAGIFAPNPTKPLPWNRGAYLVQAVVHCGECHTPRNVLGGLKDSRDLAGTRDGPDGATAPNITPDRKTGIGDWREGDLAEYLKTGMTPDGDFAGEAMSEVIERSTSVLTEADRRAIAAYLLSLPPVENDLRKRDARRQKDEF
jgi:mono/diheme cytochrome c family protein